MFLENKNINLVGIRAVIDSFEHRNMSHVYCIK